MPAATPRLFLPGFAAPARLYRPGLPCDWETIDPPRFRHAPDRASLQRWLLDEIDARGGRAVLAGHSMGAALALLAAAASPERVARLVLASPAGLPLTKPMLASARDFARQFTAGLYPLRDVAGAALEAARAPRSALRLARAVRDLDLTEEMGRVRAAGIPTTVMGCASDTLVTPAHCRRAARLLGVPYRDVCLTGGHMWMLGAWTLLAAELAG